MLIAFVIQAFSDVHDKTDEEGKEKHKIELFKQNVIERYVTDQEFEDNATPLDTKDGKINR